MSSFDHEKKQKVPQSVMRLFQKNAEYSLIDKIIIVYVAVMLLVQVMLQISPVMTYLTTTPLYSIQSYLGVLGGALIVLDIFTTKRIWQGRFAFLLYVILACAVVSSVRMISYGIKENLFKICWAAIQFVLLYSCAFRMSRDDLGKYIKTLFYIFLSIWIVACCVSLYQYINQIGYRYVVNPLAKDSSANRQGFYDNRLFGIFYTLNHAAFISLFFFLIAIVYSFKEKRIWIKVCLIIAELVLLSYIILSGSRSAFVSLLVCAAVMPWFVARNMVKAKGFVKSVICCVISLAVVVVCYFGYEGAKNVLSKVPYMKELFHYQMQQNENKAPTEVPTEAPTESPTEAPVVKPEYDEEILDRDHLDEDVSNGRFSIWTDYISLYREVGLFGMSPGNYMPYILKNHPELYIVDYIKQYYPDKYESGIIYHVHSGYVMVYVSAGIAGLISLAIFIVLCLKRVIQIIWRNKRLSWLFIGSFLIVVAGALSAVFDEGLFFQNNPQTTMFWFALGVLMNDQMAELEVSKNK